MQKILTTVTHCSREPLPSHKFDLSEIEISAFSTWDPSFKMPINRTMQSKPYVTSCWRLRECLLQESDNDHSEKHTRLQEESKSPGSHPILYCLNSIFHRQLWTEDLKHSSCREAQTRLEWKAKSVNSKILHNWNSQQSPHLSTSWLYFLDF